MKLAGANLNETLAMLTGITEIIQNASEAGNALKIYAMRIRGMKGELEELGEEVDDSVDSISKVQTQILNLTQGKVNIFDDKGDFRDYYEIMKDIAAIFGDLKSTDKANLTEILFGKQRGNAGVALVQAFQSGQVEKALNTADNSAGSAETEQSRWLESIEAKQKQLTAAWQELSLSIMNSDFLKTVIDDLRILAETTSLVIDKVGLLPGILGGVGIAAFVKNFGQPKGCDVNPEDIGLPRGKKYHNGDTITPWEESLKIRKGEIA